MIILAPGLGPGFCSTNGIPKPSGSGVTIQREQVALSLRHDAQVLPEEQLNKRFANATAAWEKSPSDYAYLVLQACDAVSGNKALVPSEFQEKWAISTLTKFPGLPALDQVDLVEYVGIVPPDNLSIAEAEKYRKERVALWLRAWDSSLAHIGESFDPYHAPDGILPALSPNNHIDKVIMPNMDPSLLKYPSDRAAYTIKFNDWQKACADYSLHGRYLHAAEDCRAQLLTLLPLGFIRSGHWLEEFSSACRLAGITGAKKDKLIADATKAMQSCPTLVNASGADGPKVTIYGAATLLPKADSSESQEP